MSETEDFVDIMVPILEAGTWTNLGHTPSIVTSQKSGPNQRSKRGNKNERVSVKNEDGPVDDTELAFDGTPILDNLSGLIDLISTSKSDRNKMKTDLILILKSSGVPFTPPRIANNPSRRNKDVSTYFLKIISC